MKKFDMQLTYSAAEDLDCIPEDQRIKIIALIKNFSSDPFTPGANIKKLKGFKPPLYRVRSGDYRILYRLQEKTITLLRVIDRKDLERIIKGLKLSKS
ncbi:MAG: type II toxin-antitoxin system RelE/ParE family toxin [Candidatus Aminicenantes bacterium]|nr:type II toxin-antitoxin system RelE/ParE family toxin [Candidatus Aminicenantes bacterium]MDH5386306.1 type II toxin-antitoxin system RelE/ParE family toxin [Candidatus Aminicenantes bacterium]